MITNNTMLSMNSGPMKLCRFFISAVIQANSVWPISGNTMCLPNSITNPEIPNTQKLMAILQWAQRSTRVKR